MLIKHTFVIKTKYDYHVDAQGCSMALIVKALYPFH